MKITLHKCYLQQIKDKKKKHRRINDEEGRRVTVEDHLVFVYFDLKAREDTGNHIANLLCAEADQNDQQFNFRGENCVNKFLTWIHAIANKEDVEKVVVVAHNFKGYDGYFILEDLYKQHVTDLSQNGKRSQDTQFRNSRCEIHRFTEFFPHALVELSKDIWNSRLKERILSAFLYYARKPNLHRLHV